jgi:hypothetical protein
MSRVHTAYVLVPYSLTHKGIFSEVLALYNACQTHKKSLLKVLEGNHNDIFTRGFSGHFVAVGILVRKMPYQQLIYVEIFMTY